MENSFRRRIRSIGNYSKHFLTEGEQFHIGLLFEDYLKSPHLAKYGLPLSFSEDNSIIPKAKGSVTKANIKGKKVRKKPEEKETVTRHIDYFHTKYGSRIQYDRDYNIYKKVILHRFEIKLYFFVNKHGQHIVSSERLINSEEQSIKNTHIANMFCEIFGDFEFFDANLAPAIHFNTKFEKIILPSGSLNRENFDELIEIGGRFAKNETEKKAYQGRLKILQEYNPDIRGKGPSSFLGYIIFGFSDLGIILLESMYGGNATYVFPIENYKENIIKDKQSVLNQKLHLKRFFHNDNWKSSIQKYLNAKIEEVTG